MPRPFLPFARPDIGEAEVQAVAECVRSGWLTTGANASALEAEFVQYLGDEGLHAVAVNSATAGLHLALEAAGVGPGDEVLVPTWTFTATAEIVRYLGANPVFVDSDSETLNMDLASARERVTERTVAILPVHFAGLPMPASMLKDFADDYQLTVVEDAAHALPATSNGRMVGSHDSFATVFSFYATKTITTGEGGMLVTRDPNTADRARIMRLHGISRDVFDRYTSATATWDYEVVAAGFKYNLPDPAAALGRVQLNRSDQMHRRRKTIAEYYLDSFRNLPLRLPSRGPIEETHAWHLFSVRLRDSAKLNRDEFATALQSAGIGVSVHFIPLHLQPYWRDTYSLDPGLYPVANNEFRRILSLPIFSAMTDGEVQRVVDTVHAVL